MPERGSACARAERGFMLIYSRNKKCVNAQVIPGRKW
jgi:hypothetical protein